MAMVVSRYHVATPPFLDRQDGIAKRVVLATRTAEWRGIGVHTWDWIEKGDIAPLSPVVLQDLLDIELLVPAEEDELATILKRNEAAIEGDEELCVRVQPTAFCQMACDYCGQMHEKQEFSADNQDRLICRVRGLLEASRYRAVQVGWFGGEPLLGLGVMRVLTPRFQALAEEFHCEYRSHITTNGLDLSDAVAAELARDLGVKDFHITLDGPAEVHDARRFTKGGGRTFERIFANVVALARRDDLAAQVLIRCNVDRRNVQGVSHLIQALADAGVLDRISDFYVAPVHDWSNDAGGLALPEKEFAEQETAWLAELAVLGFVSPRLIPRREAIRCIAVRPHAFLVDPYGHLFNCTETSLVPAPPSQRVAVSDVPAEKNAARKLSVLSTSATYALGDLSSGEQPQRRQLLGDFNERLARGEYSCPTCRMLPVCGGACPKRWFEGGVPCPSAKYNIEARLLLGYAMSRAGVNLLPEEKRG
jgi:uncharacterized protein